MQRQRTKANLKKESDFHRVREKVILKKGFFILMNLFSNNLDLEISKWNESPKSIESKCSDRSKKFAIESSIYMKISKKILRVLKEKVNPQKEVLETDLKLKKSVWEIDFAKKLKSLDLKSLQKMREKKFLGIYVQRDLFQKKDVKTRSYKHLYLWLFQKKNFNQVCFQKISNSISTWRFYLNYALNYYLLSKLHFVILNYFFWMVSQKFGKISDYLRLKPLELTYHFLKWRCGTRFYLGVQPQMMVTTLNRRVKKDFPCPRFCKVYCRSYRGF